jgi:hypothetical protein
MRLSAGTLDDLVWKLFPNNSFRAQIAFHLREAMRENSLAYSLSFSIPVLVLVEPRRAESPSAASASSYGI